MINLSITPLFIIIPSDYQKGWKKKEKPDENFYKILNDLRGVAVNINQLAKVANTYQYVDDNKYYPLANRVNDMIDDLQKFYLTPTKKNRRIYGSN